MAKENKLERPKYPIKAEKTNQKVSVEKGYRYRVDENTGEVYRSKTVATMTASEKSAVEAYWKKKAEWKKAKITAIRERSLRIGANKAKKEVNKILKEAKKEKRTAVNAAAVEAKKAKLTAAIEAKKKKLESLKK